MHERRVEDLRLLRGFLGACSADAGANSSTESGTWLTGVGASTRTALQRREWMLARVLNNFQEICLKSQQLCFKSQNSPALLECTRSTLAREKSQCTTSPLLSRLPEISSHGLLGLRVARVQTCRDVTQCERLTLDPESRAQSRPAAE